MRSIIGIVFGVALLWYAFNWDTGSVNTVQELHADGVKVAGEVVAVQEVERTRRTGGRRSRRTEEYTVRCPEIAFRLDGERRTFVERADCDRLEVGDRVTVMYAAARPWAPRLDSEAVIGDEKATNRSRWVMVGLGGLFVLVSGLGLFNRLRRFVANWGS